MNRYVVALAIALTFSGSTSNLKAHGGCYGFWPFWPFALGAGIAIASVASAQNHPSPTYAYLPPTYPQGYDYAQPPNSTVASPTQASAPSAAVVEPEPNPLSSWVPSSPGAGHWVPDATPYCYTPNAQVKNAPAAAEPRAEAVTLTHSAGNVPVYTVTPQK